jgi:hypothetical protein
MQALFLGDLENVSKKLAIFSFQTTVHKIAFGKRGFET